MPIRTQDVSSSTKRKPYNAILLNVINSPSDNTNELLHISPELALNLGSTGSFVAIRSAPGQIPNFGWTIFRISLDHSLTGLSCLLFSNNIFFTGNHLIQVIHTDPIHLDTLLLSFPNNLYEKLHNDKHEQHILRDRLYKNHGLVRQGETFIDIGCRVSLCEPMDQGVIDETTTISIAKDENEKIQLHKIRENGISDTSDSDLDDVELEITKYLESMPISNTETNFSEIISASLDSSIALSTALKPIALDHPIHPASIIPSPQLHEDMESIAFVKTERLARMGLFSGDVVKMPACGDRYVKLYSYPEPNTIPNDVIYLSPLLLHNMRIEKDILELFPCPSGSSLTKLVPICGEVTIARVASPITTEKAYQSAFLSGLRTYFENCHRIVCLDDLIAIPIDTIFAQTLSSQQSPVSKIPESIPAGKPDNIAWFKVTNISNKTGEPIKGCAFIDPKVTRMVQSGLVDSKIISTNLPWRQYTGLSKLFDFNSIGNDFEHYTKLEKILLTCVSGPTKSLRTSVLLDSSKRGTGKTICVQSACAKLGIHLYEIDCYQLIGEGDNKTIGALKARIERATSIRPCVILLKHIDAISRKSEEDGSDRGLSANVAESLEEAFKNGLNVIATTSDVDKMSETVRSKFVFEIHVGVPSESERRRILEFLVNSSTISESRSLILRHNQRANIFTGYRLREDVQISNLALQSAGLTPPDLISIIEAAKIEAEARISKFNNDIDCLIASRGSINIIPQDLNDAVSNARAKYSDSIGVPRIPNVQWSDVGGLEGVKKDILDSIEMPLKHPHLFSTGVKKRSGILFYGPPGTGKTLLAKAIATNFSLNFFSVKGPELLNMYIGESEANVRKVFQRARDARPCVVFFDELDSVAPKRGNQGDSGGVMDRIVSQLLSELDGMSGSGGEGVFVVGATNRPDLLDEALLRPGRFDKLLYLGISDTHEKQETILQALTRKFTLDPSVSLKDIAAKCPFTYTGADFYALCSDSLLNAMTRTAGEVDEKLKVFNEKRLQQGKTKVSIQWWFQNIATKDDYAVSVTEKDFMRAQSMLTPSVSADELDHYLDVRANFEQSKEGERDKTGRGKKVNGLERNGLERNVLEKTRKGKGKEKVY